MDSLADFFNKDQKNKVISGAIEIGQVYRMKLTKREGVKDKNAGDNGRNKYFIVLGIHANVAIGIVLINTKINVNISQELKNLHYPLKATLYPFLEINRFADCGSFKSITLQKFSEMFSEPTGIICADDMQYIVDAVVNSDVITPKEIKAFGLNSRNEP